MTDAPDDPVLFTVFNEVGIIEQLARNRFERRMPHGMTLAQFTMLNHFVRLGGPKNPNALARSFQVTKGAITSLLAKLSEKGFVTISPDPTDGRAKLVDITDAGRAARDDCVAALAPDLAELHRNLPSTPWPELVEHLRTLRRHLDATR